MEAITQKCMSETAETFRGACFSVFVISSVRRLKCWFISILRAPSDCACYKLSTACLKRCHVFNLE